MNRYTELSDFEINLLVAQSVLPETQYDVIKQTMDIIQFLVDGSFGYRFFDPCNNPSDAMPIIIENEISMIKSSSGWMCCHGSVGQVEHESLYRGAMELFLMMRDAERETNT
ncbi:phage protein NinX family protein [Proteus mirabilis]|uniref:phage protein NinX family protein n=1 Tax=Proteus mirabilis TaxID=584 RepID=UPI0029E3D762|nr:DUF2591 family protein [Proteus mirabilis]HEK1959399.1 DUF2591 family protein [Proteus mirabilis]HEK2985128.1 DUF2591 family protein [Proteus mirabilis]HEK3024743.1 DUF2591 family protein [Proteus mirabilis]HEK3180476.1 DUF2591 family protein [Proteus mirabilis]